ncbi:hypothetical protein VNO78_23126 [Psophocarpus tetragonolobus]|uniref:Uncharacterized protein n=1 Tax=Psophocarpus tetragonolobus TaxID=3891 RepID=A0AAN9S3K2_PSOTE
MFINRTPNKSIDGSRCFPSYRRRPIYLRNYNKVMRNFPSKLELRDNPKNVVSASLPSLNSLIFFCTVSTSIRFPQLNFSAPSKVSD